MHSTGWVKATLGYKNCRRRRAVLGVALDLLDRAEPGLLAAVCLLFLFPLLIDRSLLLDLPALLWWGQDAAIAALVAFLCMNLLAAAAVLPSQLTGATVDAMEQAAPAEGLIAFPERPVESVCRLLPWVALLQPAIVGRQAAVQAKQAWQEQVRQAAGRGVNPFCPRFFCRRQIPLPEPPAPSV
jgi:hypothetical protein